MLPAARTARPPGVRDAGDRQRVVVDVGVVGQQVGRIDDQRHVLGARGRVVDRYGASFTQVMSTVTLALALPPLPSLMS